MNSGDKKKKVADQNLPWSQKKSVVDLEEPILQKEVDDLVSWVSS
jgi:hypothetical protein